MSRLRILVAGLICGLIISLAFNVSVAWRLMKTQELYRDLSRDYDELRQSYSPNPPISKSEAIGIALEYGGWNETTLEDMEVSADLWYVMFQNSSDGGTAFMRLHEVTGNVSDYKPKWTCHSKNHYAYDCITARYVWIVVVQKKGGPYSIPPPGLYYVDAATGEITSYHDIRGGKGWRLLETPGWIMAEKIGYISDNETEIVHVTARDLLSYPKLDLALQEAEIASSKHPTEMIKLTHHEAKSIIEFLSGKPANATEDMTYFAVNHNETLYSVFITFSWTRPITL